MRIEEGFQLTPFTESNAYTTDPALPALIKRLIPPNVLNGIEPDLVRLGNDIITQLRPLGSGNKVGPPQLIQYNQWGQRVDELHTSEGWRNIKAFVQREGLPGIFYDRQHGRFSRIYGFMKALLMMGDTHEIFCPISMTDGAARVIELLGTEAMKKEVLPRLISRDPPQAWTSGQWMTERPGGSDVSSTETNATSTSQTHPYGPKYTLNGLKWFSSATDSQIAFALARTGPIEQGSRTLSLFFVPLRLPLFPAPGQPHPSSTSNNIFVHRLKNKIGTHTLPTAELILEGSEAHLIGNLNQGVKNITPLLNITRLWSAVKSAGCLRRCLSMAVSYAQVRRVNGGTTLLKDAPTHVERLASINLLYRALSHFVFGLIELLGKAECGVATKDDEEVRLRMLTPVVKAFSAEKAATAIEEAMASVGGSGYMEENGFGRLARDILVEKIWEGTTTVLALDLVRAANDPRVVQAFISWARRIIASTPSALVSSLTPTLTLLDKSIGELSTAYTKPVSPLLPRPALFLVGSIASSVYLLEHAIWSHNAKEPEADLDLEIFKRWVVESGLEEVIKQVKRAKDTKYVAQTVEVNQRMVFGRAKL